MDNKVPNLSLTEKYRVLESITSDGSCYFDLGFKGDNTTRAKLKFSYPSGTTGMIFGSRTSASSNAFAIWTSSSSVGSAFRMGWDGTGGYNGGNSEADRVYEVDMSQDGYYLDGTLVYTPTSATFNTPNNLKLFAYDTAGTVTQSAGTFYGTQSIWKNGALICNLIPVERISDSAIGFFDTVTRTFLTNQGTGTLTKGDYVLLTDNLFNPDNASTRYPNGWYTNGGIMSDANASNRTFMCPCEEGDVFTLKHFSEENGARYFFLLSDTIESGQPASSMYGTVTSTNAQTTIAAPSRAKYIGFTFWRTGYGTIQSAADDYVVVKDTSAPSSYIGYKQKVIKEKS